MEEGMEEGKYIKKNTVAKRINIILINMLQFLCMCICQSLLITSFVSTYLL